MPCSLHCPEETLELGKPSLRDVFGLGPKKVVDVLTIDSEDDDEIDDDRSQAFLAAIAPPRTPDKGMCKEICNLTPFWELATQERRHILET